jgi:hypothetical protein
VPGGGAGDGLFFERRCAVAVRADVPVVVGVDGGGVRACASVVFRTARGPGGTADTQLVITAVEDHLDTSAFHALRLTGGAGTAGYDPDMLVTVLAWVYAHQGTSSRRTGQLCGTDVAPLGG